MRKKAGAKADRSRFSYRKGAFPQRRTARHGINKKRNLSEFDWKMIARVTKVRYGDVEIPDWPESAIRS